MTQIYVGKLTIFGSDNGLSPGRRQTIIWTNAGISLIGPLGINLTEILTEIHTFSFKKLHLKMSSVKWPQCVEAEQDFEEPEFKLSLWELSYIAIASWCCYFAVCQQIVGPPNGQYLRWLARRWWPPSRLCAGHCLGNNPQSTLTHWGRDKMAAIFQTTFSNGFSWMKMFEFRFKFHWSLFLRVQSIIFQHWFR